LLIAITVQVLARVNEVGDPGPPVATPLRRIEEAARDN
jgi:hypothetical protein